MPCRQVLSSQATRHYGCVFAGIQRTRRVDREGYAFASNGDALLLALLPIVDGSGTGFLITDKGHTKNWKDRFESALGNTRTPVAAVESDPEPRS